ncbi:IS200/IS605 family accessory protein TnpB-related protein [Rivularia sp. UHCC 0363]|uniref:IS200/IS605 family accessory protein TnpB-related protein n=1 Tax=Rivularia sp. UHCC 0363 TaxID=3110244 RepID=UPI002B21EE05|nr:IS200/IS605 family accessory protein TnpB-related protein [Rivularia sp. UHCC 0363]MEA5596278.1 IS200/IS605 family accessory protein TnpB-related protein [Rivularia sp. UHCC 0363]
MSTKTFTAELPKALIPFAIKYSRKQKKHRNTALELICNNVSRTKQNQTLQKFGYNKRQANSLLIDMIGKLVSARECRKAHISTLEGKISSAQDQIVKWENKLADIPHPCCSIRRNEYKTEQHRLRHNIHHKRRYLIAQQLKLEQLRNSQLSVNFGSEFNFPLVGSQGESNGNQICQYDYKKKQLKIRVPVEWETEFGGKYIYADKQFKYGQDCIVAALMKRGVNRNTGDIIPYGKGEALTWRFFYKNNRWYISVTVEVSDTPIQSKPVRYGCIGVDFNPGVIGWCYSDYNGNPVKWGQFKVNLHSRRSGQVEAQLADVIKELLDLADNNCCPIVIENLSFCAKKKRMREEGRRYARMLNYFAYSKFNNLILLQCNNRGIQLIKVNPAYSSLIGLTKFMALYGMSSDTAAGLVLARRAMRLSESVPEEVRSPGCDS